MLFFVFYVTNVISRSPAHGYQKQATYALLLGFITFHRLSLPLFL